MESRYTDKDHIYMVMQVLNAILFTEEGQRWCKDFGVSVRDQGVFTLEDYHEEPVDFDLAIFVDNLVQEYSDERMDILLNDIYDEDMHGLFCSFQDIVFGDCWIV
jgi:hypothetical protein